MTPIDHDSEICVAGLLINEPASNSAMAAPDRGGTGSGPEVIPRTSCGSPTNIPGLDPLSPQAKLDHFRLTASLSSLSQSYPTQITHKGVGTYREQQVSPLRDQKLTCHTCGRQFATPSETKKHVASIHDRSFTWSCGHLIESDAFMDAAMRCCGYCGLQFLSVNDLEAIEAIRRHVRLLHNHRQCRIDKLFYRADHYRQHLVFSHRARRGPWLIASHVQAMKRNIITKYH